MYELRPYQEEAIQNIFQAWTEYQSTLLVLPTGLGKTVIFSEITKQLNMQGKKVLILAHRGDLLEQAIDKLSQFGIDAVLEKADAHASKEVLTVVASIQTMYRDNRLEQYCVNYFDYIIIDECHHAMSKTYQKVLNYFKDAKLLGVTATPNRSDRRSLSAVFDSIAYTYDIRRAIKEGWLSDIQIRRCPLEIDLTDARMTAGDYSSADLQDILTPYLEKITEAISQYARNRKILIFTPTIAIGDQLTDICNQYGFHAACVSGKSNNREEIKERFKTGELNVVCNALLWTEGFDEPSIDCIINLRATRSLSLYTQILGRGLRIQDGKDNLFVLDFLWQSGRKGFDILSPVDVFFDEMDKEYIEKHMSDGEEHDLFDIGKISHEEYLADQLRIAQEHYFAGNKIIEIDNPNIKYYYSAQELDTIIIKNDAALQFYFQEDEFSWSPYYKWEIASVTPNQIAYLKNLGINTELIQYKGQANQIINQYQEHNKKNKCSYKQYKILKRKGFKEVEKWKKEEVNAMIQTLAENHWRLPWSIKPTTYQPESLK